jgi:hypothetical protein
MRVVGNDEQKHCFVLLFSNFCVTNDNLRDGICFECIPLDYSRFPCLSSDMWRNFNCQKGICDINTRCRIHENCVDSQFIDHRSLFYDFMGHGPDKHLNSQRLVVFLQHCQAVWRPTYCYERSASQLLHAYSFRQCQTNLLVRSLYDTLDLF